MSALAQGVPADLLGEDAQYWIGNKTQLHDELARLLRRQAQLVGFYAKLTVNYDQSLAEMIAAGKYDWVNGDITQKNFPVKGKGQVELPLELVHFGRLVGSDEVLAECERRGLRAATLPELLALGAAYPDPQRQFPIVALGSSWRDRVGDRFVPLLAVDGRGRGLRLRWFEGEWRDYDRFLAVRK